GGPSGNEEAKTPAHGGAELAVDQFFGECVGNLETGAGQGHSRSGRLAALLGTMALAAVLGAAPALLVLDLGGAAADLDGPTEELLFERFRLFHLLQHLRVNLFEQPRHGATHRGPDFD